MYITTRSYWKRFAAGISEHQGSQPFRVYRPDGMDAWVLIYTIAGTGIIGPPEKGLVHQPGDLLLIPARIAHDYRHAPNSIWRHMWVYFTPEERWLKYLEWPKILDRVMMISAQKNTVQPKIEQAFYEIVKLYGNNNQVNYNLSQNLLERIILLSDTINPLTQGDEDKDPRLDLVKDFLLKHYQQPIAINQLAEIAGLSKSRLSVLFKENTGQTLIEYLEQIRIQSAICQLLSGSQTIQEIAAFVGYDNPFYFTRIFHKHMGMSPKAFRQQKKKK